MSLSLGQQKKAPCIAVVGATSCIAIHCVRLWLASEEATVFLIGRNSEKLQREANDLKVRYPAVRIECIPMDLCDAKKIKESVDCICESQLPSTVLIAHGTLPEQVDCENNLNVCRNALEINAISPVLWAEAFVGKMQNANNASRLVLIGSVAGDRGRQSNYIYGAAKGLLERYAQGLQHRLALKGSHLKVVLVKPGPTATPMTEHLMSKKARTLAPVNAVAQTIVDGTAKGSFVVYAPKKWALIMFVIKFLPRKIFQRLNI